MAKKISLYGILAAICITFSYIEMLIPFDFIAPGIKLGLSNGVALLLIAKNDIKGAYAVNIVRILLSSLLFSTPFTLVYSFSAGIVSLVVMSVSRRIKSISVVGFSVMGAVFHNLTQLFVAFILIGKGVLYYTPALLLSAIVCGFLTGYTAKIILNNKNFKI